MRTHRKHQAFTSWLERSHIDAFAHLRYLAAARLEPIVRGLRGGALLDLVFCSDERVAVIPFIEIVPEMLLQRESSPFVWPNAVSGAMSEEWAEEIEGALLPWLESLTLARQLNAESIRLFGDERTRELFDAAREARFLGATPYSEVLSDVAPYVYAVRFAENARAAVCDPQGAFGSVLLKRHAREVHADLGEGSRNSLAVRWFNSDLFGTLDARAPYDLAVCERAGDVDAAVCVALNGSQENGVTVSVATPVPTDVMIAFDSAESPACRTFSVRELRKPELRKPLVHAAPQSAGGSSGRILMLMRDDYARVPDGDTDEAHALASLLRAEGFTVDVAGASNAAPAGYDLVHAFTLARVNELAAPLAAAQAANIPIVMTPFFQDVSAGGAWGTAITRALLRVATDETELEDNLMLVAQRRLEAPGLSAKRQEPFSGYDQAARAALQRAGAVIVSGAEEEQQVRSFGYTGHIVTSGPCLIARESTEREQAVFGGDFVLAHGPIEPRGNLLFLVRAAAAARIPLVIAGPVVEPEYALALREQAGERVVFLAEPSAPALDALYRRARVYADLSWIPYGVHRAIRAAASGCALLLSKDHLACALLGDGLWPVDPADAASATLALGDAWKMARARPEAVESAARRAAVLGDARAALVACASAYAAAQQARTPA